MPARRDRRIPRTSSSSAPGPAGSTAAYHLATAGLDVLVLEKTSFPREKVCGDGLTPRAVKALTTMGIPIVPGDGWLLNKGLRIIGGGGRIEARLARPVFVPRIRDGQDEDRLRRDAGQARAEGRACGCSRTSRSPAPPSTSEPAGSPASRAREAAAAKDGAGRASKRRPRATSGPSAPASWSRPTATRRGCRYPWACTSGPTGRSASRSGRTTRRPGTMTTTWRPGSICGTASSCCPATAGSSGWATARATSGSAC